MKHTILTIALLLTLSSWAQDFAHLNKNSYYTYIYRIPADSVYLLNDMKSSYQYDPLLRNFQLVDSFPTESEYDKVLPAGYYFDVHVADRRLVMDDRVVSNILATILNDGKRNKLLIRTRDNQPITDAVVTFRHRRYRYNTRLQGYQIPFSNEDGRILTIEARGEKVFYDYNTDDIERPDRDDRREAREKKRREKSQSRQERLNGYIVFNKPKYLPGDTVKLKAYLLHPRNKAYTTPLCLRVDMRRSYGDHNYMTLASKLQPVTPGAYIYEFVITDTFELDKYYYVSLSATETGASLVSSNFKVEDYLLDKYSYYVDVNGNYEEPVSDTLHLALKGRDQNGRNVMDSRAVITGLKQSVSAWYTGHECVPDTLFAIEKKLSAEGETKVDIPLEWLPKVKMEINLQVDFVNAASEHHQSTRSTYIDRGRRRLIVWQEEDTIYADILQNGISVAGHGRLITTNGNEDEPLESKTVTYPYRGPVDSWVSDYAFEAYGQDTLRQSYNDYSSPSQMYRRTDSTIELYPTQGYIQYYTLRRGATVVRRGVLNGHVVTIPDRTQNTYEVEIKYIRKGDPEYRSYIIAPRSQRLNVKLAQRDEVYPGQRDSVTISVRDSKGHPIAGANVTALSYTRQFYNTWGGNSGTGLYHPLAEHKETRESGLERVTYVSKAYNIGDYPYWIHRMQLDTMLYYQLIYSPEGQKVMTIPAPGLKAQFAPFIFDHGRSMIVQMVYVDGELAYYEGTSAFMPYSIPVRAGRHNIVLRTRDRMVHLDSVDVMDGVKTNLLLQWDSIKANSDSLGKELLPGEKQLLSGKFIYYGREYADSAYIWQDESRYVFTVPAAYSYGSSTQVNAIIGPMSYSTAYCYKPKKFVQAFVPERRYAFSFSPGVVRLERTDLFDQRHITLQENRPQPDLDFTALLYPRPGIDLAPARVWRALYIATSMSGYRSSAEYHSSLQLQVTSDSTISYLRIYRTDSMVYDRIFEYSSGYSHVERLSPGTYTVMAITESGYASSYDGIVVQPYAECYQKIVANDFLESQNYSTNITGNDSMGMQRWPHDFILDRKPNTSGDSTGIQWSGEKQGLYGKVIDNMGEGIPYASISLVDSLGHRTGRITMSDVRGYYSLPGLPAGKYHILYQAPSYEPHTVDAKFWLRGFSVNILVRLKFAKDSLAAATVVASKYSSSIQSEKASISVIKSLAVQEITVDPGSDLGIALSKTPGVMRKSGSLQINGSRSDEVQYVINGHRVIGNVNLPTAGIPEPALPVSGIGGKYGDAAQGVISLEDDYKDASKMRSNFRDYAYWQPNMVTDEKGQVHFEVRYPDNVTIWSANAIGMTRKHQVGTAHRETNAYKACMAELSVPQFLVAGDSSSAAVKITDYLHKPVTVTARFVWDSMYAQQNEVTVTDMLSDNVAINAAPDEKRREIKASFTIATKGGFGDGEERSVSILPVGTEESVGGFYLLRGDTAIDVPVDSSYGAVHIHMQSDLLDVMLDEIDHVRHYPYWCMEQTASRLTMLTLLEQIHTALGRKTPKAAASEKEACIKKLQKAQLVNGAYGWWEYSPASVRMTTYVLAALDKAGETQRVNTNDAYSYLYAALRLMSISEKLDVATLFASKSDRVAEVPFILKQISFDSLSLYQQLLYVKAEFLSHTGDSAAMHHWREIQKKEQRTLFGGSYWGEDNWYWYAGRVACTVLAYDIAEIRHDAGLQQRIIQYFLETRRHGGWRNTAESAKIVSAILPRVLADRHNDIAKPIVDIDGTAISHFPYDNQLASGSASMHITKKGAAPIYLSATQQFFNAKPDAVSGDLSVSTSLQKNGQEQAALKSGETAEIIAEVHARKYGEYLMIEVPVPAGCTYGDKPQSYANGEVHREYYRDRVVIFCEEMQPGVHRFQIPVEPRYKGVYTVNPAKVQLMYFPSLYGRSAIRRVHIH